MPGIVVMLTSPCMRVVIAHRISSLSKMSTSSSTRIIFLARNRSPAPAARPAPAGLHRRVDVFSPAGSRGTYRHPRCGRRHFVKSPEWRPRRHSRYWLPLAGRRGWYALPRSHRGLQNRIVSHGHCFDFDYRQRRISAAAVAGNSGIAWPLLVC